MTTLSAAEYSWSSFHDGFATNREDLWFGRGYDPYDSAAAYHAWQTEMDVLLRAEMEQCWQKCITSAAPRPDFVLCSFDTFLAFYRAYYDALATPDRGHEFLPYG